MHPIEILYWAALMLGGVYMVCTFLMGGLSHGAHQLGDAIHSGHFDVGGHHIGHIEAGHAGHIEAGHTGHVDAGHAGNGHTADSGHHAHHEGGHQGDEASESKEGGSQFSLLRYLNPLSVAGFLFGFGWSGILARMIGATPIASALWAVAAGWGFWLMVYLFVTRIFGMAGGSSHNRREQIIGLRATVTAPIAGKQPGMVCYVVGGTRQSVRAITDEEEAIPTGSTVRIRRIENQTAHVIRLDG